MDLVGISKSPAYLTDFFFLFTSENRIVRHVRVICHFTQHSSNSIHFMNRKILNCLPFGKHSFFLLSVFLILCSNMQRSLINLYCAYKFVQRHTKKHSFVSHRIVSFDFIVIAGHYKRHVFVGTLTTEMEIKFKKKYLRKCD